MPDDNKMDLDTWVKNLYDPKLATEDIIREMTAAFAYKGFNREDILKQLHVFIQDPNLVIQLIVVSALRGPKAASQIKLLNGKTPAEMGIPASGGQGSKMLTMNKITAATADLAAFYLKKMNCPKRIKSDLPAWLQFPSAGGIKLPSNLREQHIEFSKRFSPLIGGQYNESIYIQMETNSYIDERLKLFDV